MPHCHHHVTFAKEKLVKTNHAVEAIFSFNWAFTGNKIKH